MGKEERCPNFAFPIQHLFLECGLLGWRWVRAMVNYLGVGCFLLPFFNANHFCVERDIAPDSGNKRGRKVCVQLQKILCSSLRHCNPASREIKSCTGGPFQNSYMIVYPRV